MVRIAVLVSLLLTCLVASPSLQAQIQEEHQDDYSSECLADWDPFLSATPPRQW